LAVKVGKGRRKMMTTRWRSREKRERKNLLQKKQKCKKRQKNRTPLLLSVLRIDFFVCFFSD
jgi:hypothetical protein